MQKKDELLGEKEARASSLPPASQGVSTCHRPTPLNGIGVNRRCKLWPETVAALSAFETSDYVFITKYGNPWTAQSVYDNPISREMTKLLNTTALT
jgi:hypothetical protein